MAAKSQQKYFEEQEKKMEDILEQDRKHGETDMPGISPEEHKQDPNIEKLDTDDA